MPFKKEAMQAVEEMKAQDELVDKIAAAFLRQLCGALVDDTRPHMKDQAITRYFVENANDYYDANMLMDAAFKEHGLPTFDKDGHMTQETVDLFNVAWERAAVIAGFGDKAHG